MTAAARTIVVAGAAEEFSRLAEPLRLQGFELHHCGDGAAALELALRLQPPLMLVDTAVAVLPAPRLAQILRANPRTAELAFIFVGREGEMVEGFRRHRDLFVPRPYNPEQLIASVLGYFGRRAQTQRVGRRERQIEGDLSQISLVDLLQILGLNRKEGVLHLARGTERGEVHLADGMAINARVGPVEGEKAFFRLLRWNEGKLWFVPGPAGTEARIDTPLDHLIMEGMRQSDELDALSVNLPPSDTELVLAVPRDRLPQGLRPTTREVLLLLEYHRRVQELLDRCARPDLEVLQVLRALIEKGLVEPRRPGTPEPPERLPLLGPEEVIAVREHLGRRGALPETGTAKLLLLASATADVRALLEALRGIEEFVPADDFLLRDELPGPGEIGRLVVADTLALRLLALPAASAAVPLWSPFCRGLLGVVALATDGSLAEAENYFAAGASVPVARVATGGDAREGAFPLRRGDRRALRDLLAFFAARHLGATPSPEGT